MSIIVPKTCPGGLHRLEWIVDGDIAICKNGHEGILWVVAEHNRLRCETNPVARTLAKFISENRIIRQNPTEDQTAISVQIAENIVESEEINAPAMVNTLLLHSIMRDAKLATFQNQTAKQNTKADFRRTKNKQGQPKKILAAAAPQVLIPVAVLQEVPIPKIRIGRAIRKAEGVLRGKRDNIQFLPADVIYRSHEEYKEWRTTMKMPQRDVAKILLLSRGLVSDIDIGRRPYSTFVAYQFSMYISGKLTQGA